MTSFYAQSIMDVLDDYLTADEKAEVLEEVEKAVKRIVESARSEGFVLGFDEGVGGEW